MVKLCSTVSLNSQCYNWAFPAGAAAASEDALVAEAEVSANALDDEAELEEVSVADEVEVEVSEDSAVAHSESEALAVELVVSAVAKVDALDDSEDEIDEESSEEEPQADSASARIANEVTVIFCSYCLS